MTDQTIRSKNLLPLFYFQAGQLYFNGQSTKHSIRKNTIRNNHVISKRNLVFCENNDSFFFFEYNLTGAKYSDFLKASLHLAANVQQF